MGLLFIKFHCTMPTLWLPQRRNLNLVQSKDIYFHFFHGTWFWAFKSRRSVWLANSFSRMKCDCVSDVNPIRGYFQLKHILPCLMHWCVWLFKFLGIPQNRRGPRKGHWGQQLPFSYFTPSSILSLGLPVQFYSLCTAAPATTGTQLPHSTQSQLASIFFNYIS